MSFPALSEDLHPNTTVPRNLGKGKAITRDSPLRAQVCTMQQPDDDTCSRRRSGSVYKAAAAAVSNCCVSSDEKRLRGAGTPLAGLVVAVYGHTASTKAGTTFQGAGKGWLRPARGGALRLCQRHPVPSVPRQLTAEECRRHRRRRAVCRRRRAIYIFAAPVAAAILETARALWLFVFSFEAALERVRRAITWLR